ncbi:hypothetical protein [Streptomyces sp. NPDC007100]|uniref:hypothetical protein n=1 Tax=Streptomyces sp. NPDC007100 TaxID=3155602 RepID=UPI0033DA3523
MNEHRGTLDPPVYLLDPYTGGINPDPKAGCRRCAAEAVRRDEARRAGLVTVAVAASNEIYRHPRHRGADMGNKGGSHSGKPDTAGGDGHRDRPPGPTKPYEPPKK